MQLPFGNRYRHWLKGFLIEVGLFAAFIVLVDALAVVAALVFG